MHRQRIRPAPKPLEGDDSAGAQMRYVDSPYAAAQDADALLILNDWGELLNSIWRSCITRCGIRL